MKKSPVKVFFKSIFLTMGILFFLYGILNPTVYFFGKSADAVCDSADFTEKDGISLYDCHITFHYFAKGAQYDGEYSFTSAYDETIADGMHTVKYIPFIPSYGIIDLGYFIPLANYISAGVGFVFIISGIFLKASSKEKKAQPVTEPSFICPACRKEIDSDSIYCNHCGRKIIE